MLAHLAGQLHSLLMNGVETGEVGLHERTGKKAPSCPHTL
jgi:hypothetical protein